jgi:hypothetical protein
MLAWALSGMMLAQQPPKPSEYQVKAAYLYNFGKFVAWPVAVQNRNDSFAICIIGQDPFGTMLDNIVSGEAIGGKAVVPRRITKLEEVAGCRILFISGSEESRLREILTAVDKAAVLTVSDISGFCQRGGMIQFVLLANKVRFEVDLRPAAQAGLSLSSELLKVAVTVKGNPQSGD